MTFEQLFAIEPVGGGRWRGVGVPATDEPRVFGGVLIGQAIIAASALTRPCHALHGFFVNAASMLEPFDIDVTTVRDGGSFGTRRIDVRQGTTILFAGHSSHHEGDPGPERQSLMPDLPPPESLEDQRAVRAGRAGNAGSRWRRFLADEMLDVRPVDLPPDAGSGDARRAIWFRPRARMGAGPALHKAVIGFASDTGLVHVGLMGHGFRAVQSASLDHSIWFHRDASADGWMLHLQRSSGTANGRGLSQAEIFSSDGTLVASVAQQFLARTRRE